MWRRLGFLVQVLIPVAVCSIVLWWPVRPLWVCPVQGCRLLGFNEERQSFLTLDEVTTREIGSSVLVVERDVETGQELHRMTVTVPQGRNIEQVQPLVRDRLLVVHQQERTPVQFEIVDARTGKSLTGLITSGGAWAVAPLPDAKWLWGYDAEAHLTFVALDGRQLTTRLPNSAPYSPRFSREQTQVATVVRVRGSAYLAIYDLSAGELKRSYPLPPKIPWGYVKSWQDGEFVLGTLHGDAGRGVVRSECYSFTVQGEALSEPKYEPDLSDQRRQHLGHGSNPYAGSIQNELREDQIVRYRYGSPEPPLAWVQTALRWLEQNAGWDGKPTDTDRVTVQVIDRSSGRVLRELNARGCRSPALVSPDCRRVVSYSRGILSMWDLDAGPRWSWAVGGGVLTAGLVVAYRRRRFGRSPTAA